MGGREVDHHDPPPENLPNHEIDYDPLPENLPDHSTHQQDNTEAVRERRGSTNQNQHAEQKAPHPNEEIGMTSCMPDLRTTAAFIHGIKTATLENSNMHKNDIERLREAPRDFPFDVKDPYFLFSLRSFFAVTNASEETYNSFRAAAIAWKGI